MRMEVSQQLRPELQLHLSPKLIQSMEILQLPLARLQERIREELEKNPVLEQVDGPSGEDRPPPPRSAAAKSAAAEAPLGERHDPAFGRLDRVAGDYGDYFQRGQQVGRRHEDGERDRKLDAMANTAAPGPGLREHLVEQLAFFDATPEQRALAGFVIDHLSADGRLATPLPELFSAATVEVPGITPADLESALAVVQKLDPAGVGARDLRECLLLQLDRMPDAPAAARKLVENHLDDLANNRRPAIAKRTGLSLEAIEDALRVVRALHPRPGLLVGDEPVPHVTPDLIFEWDAEADDGRGGWTVRLTDDNFPNLSVSEDYRKLLRAGGRGGHGSAGNASATGGAGAAAGAAGPAMGTRLDGGTREFLQNNIRSAHWLINAVEQRRNTLLRVARKLIEHQSDYITKGSASLRPLPMTQVAAELGIHVGTVSRAVHDKFAQTPRGIVSLRSFFTGGTQSADGEDIAWDAVRAKLVDIIAHEDKIEPLNDGEIVDRLKDQGIVLARRTVAKYRKLLKIPSARRRRQFTDNPGDGSSRRRKLLHASDLPDIVADADELFGDVSPDADGDSGPDDEGDDGFPGDARSDGGTGPDGRAGLFGIGPLSNRGIDDGSPPRIPAGWSTGIAGTGRSAAAGAPTGDAPAAGGSGRRAGAAPSARKDAAAESRPHSAAFARNGSTGGGQGGSENGTGQGNVDGRVNAAGGARRARPAPDPADATGLSATAPVHAFRLPKLPESRRFTRRPPPPPAGLSASPLARLPALPPARPAPIPAAPRSLPVEPVTVAPASVEPATVSPATNEPGAIEPAAFEPGTE